MKYESLYDWIAPGEFTYDYDGMRLCFGPINRRRFWSGRRVAWLRRVIVFVRRFSGYPPLWWVVGDALGPWSSPDTRGPIRRVSFMVIRFFGMGKPCHRQ